jgi:hypothetical protein
VKLFFDEDSGAGVAQALKAVGLPARWVGQNRKLKKGTEDEIWMPIAAREGWLVISSNRAIIESEAQRAIFMREKLGAIFLSTGHERKVDVLNLILRKWDWLEKLDAEELRWVMPISGRNPRRLTLTMPDEAFAQGDLL